MIRWNIFAEGNNPSSTFYMMVDSMVMSMGLHDPGTFDHLTLSAPFLRISSVPGWATCRFRRDVVHIKVLA